MVTDAETLIIAVATVDGDSMPKGHFGEAARFDLYRVGPATAERLRTIANRHAPEDHHDHADDEGARKAAGIGRLLRGEGVQVLVSRAFGPNIRRMRRNFLPVVVGGTRVDEAVAAVQAHWDEVGAEWRRGEERRHLVLRGSSGGAPPAP